MAAKLVAEEGFLKGLVLSLEEGEQWVIGRDPDACQLIIEDPSASRKHLVCRMTPQGIEVENLSTTNPVQVNDAELNEPRLLHHGDTLKIGDGTFRFYSETTLHLFENGENGTENADAKPSIVVDEDGLELKHGTAQAADDDLEYDIQEGEISQEDSDKPAAYQKPKPDVHQETNAYQESKPEVHHEVDAASEPKPDVHQETDAAPEPELDTYNEKPEVHHEADTASEPELDTYDGAADIHQESDVHPEPDPDTHHETEQSSTEKENETLPNLTPVADLTSVPEEIPDDESVEIPHDSIFNEEPSANDALAEINFGLLETGRWLLKVVGGPNNGAEFSMVTDSSYLIGTDPNTCDLVFHDNSVSRQHIRITIDKDDAMMIEDLKSRNGTLVDGEPLKGKQSLPSNTVVSLGTTSFVIFDREGEMQTIISPLLPSIVKVLQKEEAKPQEGNIAESEAANTTAAASILPAAAPLSPAEAKAPPHPTTTIGAFILISIITGLFVIAAIGTSTLFKSEMVPAKEQVDNTKILDTALAPFAPNIKYTFNKDTGRLLLVGHVLTATDKNRLLYTLQGMKFIKNLDDSGIVIDEYVWHEINQVIRKNPDWKGVIIQSPSAGHFILSGYLKTRAQASRLDEYMSNNFPYLDLLEKRIVVDESIISSVNTLLDTMGFKDVKVRLENGEIALSGKIPLGKSADVDALIAEIRNIHGVRNVRNLLTEATPDQSVINISDRYDVTGSSNLGGTLNVVINGRILMKGDILDGMTITSVQAHTILLEKDGIKYRIDFSK